MKLSKEGVMCQRRGREPWANVVAEAVDSHERRLGTMPDAIYCNPADLVDVLVAAEELTVIAQRQTLPGHVLAVREADG